MTIAALLRSRRRTLSHVGAIVIAVVLAVPLVAQAIVDAPIAPYHVIAAHTLGGDGGWDYISLDTVYHRLFVARSDRVMVIDEESGKLLGEITGLHRTHGVAFSYPAGHGFVTGSGDSSVTMFDLATLKVLGTTKADAGADALIFDPASSHIFSFNGGANSSTVVDGSSGQRVASIALGGRPEFAAADGMGKVFVNLEDSSAMVEIDAKTNKVTRRWPLAPCESPSGLTIDVAHHRLFSGCENKMMAISDYQTGKVIATVPIGTGVDANRFDPATGLAFASNGEGTITVVREESPEKFTVLQTIATAPGARTMEIDRTSHRLFTVTARFGPVPEQATPANPRRRPPILPDSFVLLVLGR
jgi:DNA-binding beta-propeller fold protein YncE